MKRNLISCAIVLTLAISHSAYGQYADQYGWGQPSQLGQRVQPNQSQFQANRPVNHYAQTQQQGFGQQRPIASAPAYGSVYQVARQDERSPSDAPAYSGPANPNIAPGPNQGSGHYQAPHNPQPQAYGQGTGNCAGNCGGNCGGGCGSVYRGAMSGGWSGVGCGPAGCGPNQIGGRLAGFGQARSANWIAGINGLMFNRDYEDDKGLSYEVGMPSNNLHTTDADLGGFGGIEGFIGRRGCNGIGWEARYWGLFPSEASVMLGNSPYTVLQGFNHVNNPASGFNAYQIFNTASDHTLTRENEFHNFEINILRNGGCITGRRCNSINFEMIAGVRYFKFDEYMRYFATNSAPYPTALSYDINVDNEMIGFQLGGRTSYQVGQCWNFNVGTKLGIYNNRIRHSQRIIDNNSMFGVINTGPWTSTDYDFMSSKEDLSFIGEFDFGLSYQFSQCTRLSFGYRAIAVAGIALGPDQIPYNFTDIMEINRINSNGSLILHGAYAGLEYCF